MCAIVYNIKLKSLYIYYIQSSSSSIDQNRHTISRALCNNNKSIQQSVTHKHNKPEEDEPKVVGGPVDELAAAGLPATTGGFKKWIRLPDVVRFSLLVSPIVRVDSKFRCCWDDDDDGPSPLLPWWLMLLPRWWWWCPHRCLRSLPFATRLLPVPAKCLADERRHAWQTVSDVPVHCWTSYNPSPAKKHT